MPGLRDLYQKQPYVASIGEVQTPVQVQDTRSELGKGFRRGVAGIQSGVQNLWARGQETFGDTEGARANYAAARERQEQVGAENAPAVGSIADVHDMSSAGDYLAGAVGEGIPSMAAMVAGGAATKSMMRNTAALRYLGPTAAKRLAGEAVKDTFAKQVAYTLPTSFALSAGEHVGGQDNSDAAMQRRTQDGLLNKDNLAVGGVGLAAGALDTVIPAKLIGKFGAGHAVGSGLRNAVKEVGQEGLTEMAQQGIGNIGHTYSGNDQSVDNSITGYLDAGVKGMAGAGPMVAGANLAAPLVNGTAKGFRAIQNGKATVVDGAKTAIEGVKAGMEGRTPLAEGENASTGAIGAAIRGIGEYGKAVAGGVKDGFARTDLGQRVSSVLNGLSPADAVKVREAVAQGVETAGNAAGSVSDHIVEAVKGAYGGVVDNAVAERVKNAFSDFDSNPEALGASIKQGIQTVANAADAVGSGAARGAARSQLAGQAKAAYDAVIHVADDPVQLHQFAYNLAKQAGDTAGTGIGAFQGALEGVNGSKAVIALKGYIEGLPKDAPDARERTREATRAALDKAYDWVGDSYTKARDMFTPNEKDTPEEAQVKDQMTDFLTKRMQEIDPDSLKTQTPQEAARARKAYEGMMNDVSAFAEQAKTEFGSKNPFMRDTAEAPAQVQEHPELNSTLDAMQAKYSGEAAPATDADPFDQYDDIGDQDKYSGRGRIGMNRTAYNADGGMSTEQRILKYFGLDENAPRAQIVQALEQIKRDPAVRQEVNNFLLEGKAVAQGRDELPSQGRLVNDYGATNNMPTLPAERRSKTSDDATYSSQPDVEDQGFGEYLGKAYHYGKRGEFHAVMKGPKEARTEDYRHAAGEQARRARTEGQAALGWENAHDYLAALPRAEREERGAKIMEHYKRDITDPKYDAYIQSELDDPKSRYRDINSPDYHDGEALHARAQRRADNAWQAHINRQVITNAARKLSADGNTLAAMELLSPEAYKEKTGQTPSAWRKVIEDNLGADYMQHADRRAEQEAERLAILKRIGFPTSGGQKVDAEIRIPDKKFAAMKSGGGKGNVTIVFKDLAHAREVFGPTSKKEVQLNPVEIYNYGKERLASQYDKLDANTQRRMFTEGMATLLADPRIEGVTDAEGNALHTAKDGSIVLRDDKAVAWNPDKSTATMGDLNARARADSGSEFDRDGGTEGKAAAKKVRGLAEVYTLGELHASHDVLSAFSELNIAKKRAAKEADTMNELMKEGVGSAAKKAAQRQTLRTAEAALKKAQTKTAEVMAQHGTMLADHGIDANTFSKVGGAVHEQLNEVERRLEAADRIGLKDASANVDEALADAGETNYSRERASEGGFGSTDTTKMNDDGRSTDVSDRYHNTVNVEDRPFKHNNPRASANTPTMRKYEENFADGGEPVAVGIDVGSRSSDAFKRSIDAYIKAQGDNAVPALKDAVAKLEKMPKSVDVAARLSLAKQAIERLTPKEGADTSAATKGIDQKRPVNEALLEQKGLPAPVGHEAYMRAPVDGGNETGRAPASSTYTTDQDTRMRGGEASERYKPSKSATDVAKSVAEYKAGADAAKKFSVPMFAVWLKTAPAAQVRGAIEQLTGSKALGAVEKLAAIKKL